MKHNVIEFFQNLPQGKEEQFAKAYELYRMSPGKNHGTERLLNVTGYTEQSLQNLLYDLQKLHNITDVEKIPVAKFVVKEEKKESKIPAEILAFNEEELRAWAKECNAYGVSYQGIVDTAMEEENEFVLSVLISERIVLIEKSDVNKNQPLKIEDESNGNRNTDSNSSGTAPDSNVSNGNTEGDVRNIEGSDSKEIESENQNLKEELETITSEKEDLESEKEDLEYENDQLTLENDSLKAENEALKNAPVLEPIHEKGIREEFPFLNNADCPNELKILVADKITAWNVYVGNHNDLIKIESGELIVADNVKTEIAASAVKAFEENQKIYAELNSYKETGKILGEHPIFKKLQWIREIDVMTNEELFNYKNSSAKYFSVNKKALAKAEESNDEEKIAEINNRVAERQEKLLLVNKKLGV